MPVSNGDLSFDTKEAHHPMTASEEKVAIQAILEAAEAQVKEGDKYYLVSYRWWKQWTAYVGEETSNNNSNDPVPVNCLKPPGEATVSSKRPSSIDNSDLVINRLQEDNNSEIELRDTLSENHDYVLLPEQVWEAFYKWYGGGPALARKVIKIGSTHQDGLAVEVYPLRLRLTVTPIGSQLIVRLSKMDTVGELCQRARELFNLGSQKIRIWDYFGKTKHALMNDPMQTLQDAELQMDHDVLLEEQVGGSWPDDSCSLPHENGYSGKELALVPVEPCRSSFSIAGGPTGSRTVISPSSEQFFSYPLSNLSKDLDGGFGLSSTGLRTGPLGLTGLQNLGNTCFMNSALQCLAHTPQLVEFFLQDYSQEINRQNPLGMEGELAIAFGELLRKLWAPGRAPVAPRSFKAKLARFAPQFSGYNQHDSQELLAFLLDGLHEDLNRVKLKPYIEAKDTDGRPDQEVALENWENHKARNDSIIVDICQGQYKSTLVCPVCSKVSVTFDPFMYLSLPLPSTSSRTITVRVMSSDGSAPPIPYTVTVPKQGRCRDLIQAIGKACNLRNDERILLAELYNHRHFRLLEDPLDWLGPVCDDDHVAAYRIPKTSEKPPLLVFMNRRLEEDPINSQGTRQLKSFGAPLLACLPEQGLCTGQDLLDIFETLLKPLLKAKHLEVSQSSADKERKKNGMIDHTDEDEEMLGQESCLLKAEISLDDISVGENINGFGSGMNDSSQQHPQLFQLWFIEEKSMGINVAIESDKPLPATFSSARLNSRIHIAVDWSEKSIATYDIKHLEAMPEVYKSGFPAKKVRQEAVSLYTCLEAFLKEEPLGPEDMWYCPLCKEHRQASKKLDLWRLPEILVVHLKRFSYSRYLKNKLETFVNFPIHDLDLTKYISRTDGPLCHLYELYAVSNHYGSMGGGHYTAYAKLIDDNRWYNFDDSHVALVGEDEIKTAAAYVLFYRRIRTENSAMSNGGPILFENGAISNGGSILMMHKHH